MHSDPLRRRECTIPPDNGGSQGSGFRQRAVLAVVLAFGVVLWQQLVDTLVLREQAPLGSLGQYLLLDAMLAVPFAAGAIWVADRVANSARLANWRHQATYAAVVSLAFTALMVPMVVLQARIQTLVANGDEHSNHASAVSSGLVGMARYGLRYAVLAEPVAFVLALLTVAAFLSPLRTRRASLTVKRAARIAVVAGVTAVMTSPPGLTPVSQAAGPNASPTTTAASAGCDGTAPKRTYDVEAINVDISLNQTGDHDPFGYMYALSSQVPAIRAFELATTGGNANDPAYNTATYRPDATKINKKVTTGLRDDVIQPLTMRARLGECLVINFKNNLTHGPKGGPLATADELQTDAAGNPITPSVSLDVQGLAYKVGDGGNSVGANPTSRMTAPGATNTYRYYLDPLAGEGGKVFHSGGDARELTAHGLFGAVIAEPAGSNWFNPRTGANMTATQWSSWDAMIQPGSGPTFREFAIMYHEVGDENFNIRRPVTESAVQGPNLVVGPGADGHGVTGPMVDSTLPAVVTLANGTQVANIDPTGTDTYRPGSRAINYRSDSFWRRLQQLGKVAFPNLVNNPDGTPNVAGVAQLAAMLKDKKALGYSAYTFGDPSTPIPRSYLGEPTKTRLMHPGSEQLHVHHLHGGGDRWRAMPTADDPNAFATGLKKDSFATAKSIRLDSQTVGPDESYNLEHECGAGGCQQGAGDFLFHCHIAQHYVAGMWSFWRVHDTAQSDLAPLPGKAKPAAGVTSDALLGKTFEGKTIVQTVTNPATQVSLKSWVEGQLPPPGKALDNTDATVWDWSVTGPATAPVYMTEPQTQFTWDNYDPGARRGLADPILFDPKNGRYAWPLMQPHLGQRPPFSPNGHGGAPWLGNTASTQRPDGLCPANAPVRTYNVTAINVAVQVTPKVRDDSGRIFVLNEDKAAVKSGAKAPEPFTIRSNVGDCVALTLSSELNTADQVKVNMHTHFVQFDPQASDGVITGRSYEQSVGNSAGAGNTTLAAAAAAGATTITVPSLAFLRGHDNISIAVGLGEANIEIRNVTAVNTSTNTVTLDKPLTKPHAANEATGTEFVQYMWYSDVDSGTIFFHDHVDGITSWAHGLFAAHIIEPPGSKYLDPRDHTKEIRSGTQADIQTTGSVGVGQTGSFREFMIFMTNGQRGRPELATPFPAGRTNVNALNFGQECEEGRINLFAEPLGERVPKANTVNDRETRTRTTWNGGVCRNGYLDPATGARKSTPETVQTTDPYAYSSVKYGDPNTPLLRAYVGDPVVIRTIGSNERVEGLKIQGHRFRKERFAADGELMDAATTGISERFDYILDGGAGGPSGMPGDYMYSSTRNFAMETGAWGIFRVFDTRQASLEPLPGRTAPPTGAGFPRRSFTGGNPTGPTTGDSTKNPCPTGAPSRPYDVSIFNTTLPSGNKAGVGPVLPAADDSGIVYSLTSDKAAIQAGTKRLDPLVLRVNVGDCVAVTLHNEIDQNSAAAKLYGGSRAGFNLSKLLGNPQQSAGAAIGFNPDTTVAAGGTFTYRFFADQDLGTSIFQNLGSEASMLHGAYGLLITEPRGSIWLNNETGGFLGASATSTAAAIIVPFGQSFRDFAVTMSTTDQHLGRSIIPYWDTVAGSSEGSRTAVASPNSDDDIGAVGNVPVVPPNAGLSFTATSRQQPGMTTMNYHNAELMSRVGSTLSTNPGDGSRDYGNAQNQAHGGLPDTAMYRSFPGDPVIFRVGIGASNQFHSFFVSGHEFPQERKMWDDATDHRSAVLPARVVTGGETLDAEMIGGAGGTINSTGDFQFGDARGSFNRAGLWGIFRVIPFPGGSAPTSPVALG